jgi:cation:H+ antiporter
MIALGWFVLGLAALIGGAELMVRGGSRLAGQLGVTPLVIGLTVVAVGTSAPELAVGVVAALRGSGSLAVGNIAGTNTVNLLFILGLSALLTPLALQMRTLRFDLPAMIAAAVALMAMAWDGVLTGAEGAVLVVAAIVYTAAIVRWTGARAGPPGRSSRRSTARRPMTTRPARWSRASPRSSWASQWS